MKKETNGGKADATCRINGQSRSEPESVWPQEGQKMIPFFYQHLERRLRV